MSLKEFLNRPKIPLFILTSSPSSFSQCLVFFFLLSSEWMGKFYEELAFSFHPSEWSYCPRYYQIWWKNSSIFYRKPIFFILIYFPAKQAQPSWKHFFDVFCWASEPQVSFDGLFFKFIFRKQHRNPYKGGPLRWKNFYKF